VIEIQYNKVYSYKKCRDVNIDVNACGRGE